MDARFLSAFDTNSDLTAFTDADGNTITYAYRLPGQLTQIFLPANPTVAVLTNTYDSMGRVMSQSGSIPGLQTIILPAPAQKK